MTKKIKILYVIGSSNVGGAERAFCYFIKKLDKNDFEVYIACPGQGVMVNEYSGIAADLCFVDFQTGSLLPYTIPKLKRFMKDKCIDVVHTELFNSDLAGIIAARLAGVAAVISTIQGYNFSLTGRPDIRSLVNKTVSLFYRFIYIFCDRVTAVCEAIRTDLIGRAGINIAGSRIAVIYNSIEESASGNPADFSNMRHIKEFKDKGFKIVAVIANFDRVKGQAVLVRAIPYILKIYPLVKFIFAGDGEDREHVERLADSLGVKEAVVFTGVIENSAALMELSDIIALPSFYEGFPLVAIEAMRAARPIVASRTGGIPEVVREGRTGLLADIGSSDSFAVLIAGLLADDRMAKEMGSAAAEEFKNNRNLHASSCAAAFSDLYKQVLEEKGLPEKAI